MLSYRLLSTGYSPSPHLEDGNLGELPARGGAREDVDGGAFRRAPGDARRKRHVGRDAVGVELLGAQDARLPQLGRDAREPLREADQLAADELPFYLRPARGLDRRVEVGDRRLDLLVNRGRARGRLRTDARRARRERRGVLGLGARRRVEEPGGVGRPVALERYLAEADVRPGERRRDGQRRRERRVELALGLVRPVLFEQRAREHDASLLARGRAREHLPRERLGARGLLAELDARLLDGFDQTRPLRRHVVSEVRLRVEFLRVNFDADDLGGRLELRLAEVLGRDARRGGQALAARGYGLHGHLHVERAGVAQVRDPRARALDGEPDEQVRVGREVEERRHEEARAVAAGLGEARAQGGERQRLRAALRELPAQGADERLAPDRVGEDAPDERALVGRGVEVG